MVWRFVSFFASAKTRNPLPSLGLRRSHAYHMGNSFVESRMQRGDRFVQILTAEEFRPKDFTLPRRIFGVDMHQLDRRQRNPRSSDDAGLGGGIVVVMTLDAGAPLDLAQPRLPSARHLSMSTPTRTPTCSNAASKIAGTDGSAINAAVRATATACLHGSSSTSTPPGRSRCVFWPNS